MNRIRPSRDLRHGGLLLFALLTLSASVHTARAADVAAADTAMSRGEAALAAGRLDAAMVSFAEAASLYAKHREAGRRVDALVRLATAQQAAGHYRDAGRSLEEALPHAEELDDGRRVAAVLGALGDVYLALGPPDRARSVLERGLELAQDAGDDALAASILNNLGNERAFAGDFAGAGKAYAKSASLAKGADRAELEARARANGARAALELGDRATAREQAAAAAARAHELLPSVTKANLLLNVARTTSRAGDGAAGRKQAHAYLSQALDVATEIDNPRLASYALGYLAELYEEEGRAEEALGLARRAIFAAQEANAPESLYEWHRLAGRILAERGATGAAIQEYQRAVAILQELRQETGLGYGSAGLSFRESVGPIYLELVDVLLRTALEAGDPAEEQRLILAARDAVEQLKAAELRDYFQDDCVGALQKRLKDIDEVSTSAVVVYPILLPDRIEILLSIPGIGMRRHSTPVGSEQVTREVRAFRHLLEKRTTGEYLRQAQRLHAWLIDPFVEHVAALDIDTLVFVADGPLLTVPMAALHDGERYLGERWAVAVAPGVELTDPRPLDREKLRVLLLGLSESTAGYPALSYVSDELASVKELYAGEVLLDQDFELDEMKARLVAKSYNVVHIATHGEIRADVNASFLLAYDGQLTMNHLEEYVGMLRFRDTPLELLTLSACETAAGDDRAALGLSGVAIKAGARSALGTLWRVNDAASATLIVEFYRQLKEPSVSRAVALQRAQARLREDRRYRHPFYWSPFLLISSWL
jgi:CHAT domain-containing protein